MLVINLYNDAIMRAVLTLVLKDMLRVSSQVILSETYQLYS